VTSEPLNSDARPAINAALAAAVGWTIKPDVLARGIEEGLPVLAIQPDGTIAYLPDFFTSAEASRALIVWLAAQPRQTRAKFLREITLSLLRLKQFDVYITGLDWLACPLEQIALAAAAALGEME
jgi:hypothetical protein